MPGRHSQATHETGAEIADNISVEVGQNENIVQFRLLNQLHAHVVDDSFFKLDVRIILGHFRRGRQVQSVGVLHDVGFVDGCDFLAAVRTSVIEGATHNAFRSANADRLDRHAGFVARRLDLAVRRLKN